MYVHVTTTQNIIIRNVSIVKPNFSNVCHVAALLVYCTQIEMIIVILKIWPLWPSSCRFQILPLFPICRPYSPVNYKPTMNLSTPH